MAKAKKKAKTKLYLAVYLGKPSAMRKFEKLSPKVRREKEMAGMQGWMGWARKNGRAIADMGGPLGTTKRISRRGIANIANELGAFTVVRAKSHAEAAKMFRNHPHFTIFPGESVEVMEILPIPRM